MIEPFSDSFLNNSLQKNRGVQQKKSVPPSIRSHINLLELACPECKTFLSSRESTLHCNECNLRIPIINKVPRFYDLLDPPPAKSLINKQNPRSWTQWRKMNYRFFERALHSYSPKSRVLDVGSGNAPFFDLFSQYDLVSIDFQSFESVDVVTDLTKNLPFQTNAFDIVLLSNVLEHIPNPDHLMKEIHRVLKPGGILINAVPFLIKIHQAPYDFARYTEFMLEKLHKDANFENYLLEKMGNLTTLNLFFDQVFKKRILSEFHSSFVKTLITKILLKISSLTKKSLLRFLAPQLLHETDQHGYPWGYGTIARKPH